MSYGQTQTLNQRHPASARVPAGFGGTVRRLAGRALGTFLLWQERAAERHRLAGLSDHHLKDIGLSRADAYYEADKPFWRA